jgi:hypothetical protein
MLILIEEDDLLGGLQGQIACSLNSCQLLIVERIGRMDMLTAPLIAQIKAL